MQPLNLPTVIMDDEFAQSGVHWRWDNRQRCGRQPLAQPLSARGNDAARSSRLWELSDRLVGMA